MDDGRFDLKTLLLIALPVFLLAVAAGEVHAFKSATPTNTSVLPVVLSAKDVPALEGARIVSLSGFSCREERPEPLLFQVDERNEQDRYVSSEAGSTLTRDESPGVLDANDEIVFMASDLGNACGAEALARVRGTLIDVELSGENYPETGHVYLLLGDKGYVPNRSLIEYDATTHTVSSNAYTMGYDPAIPFIYKRLNYTDLKGRAKEDILDRLKVRIEARALGSLVTLRFDEEDFDASLDALKRGPIRVIREMTVRVPVAPGVSVTAKVTFLHYERLWQGIVTLDIPDTVATVTSSMDVALIHDFVDLRGLKLSTSGLPQGTLIDGRMIELERNLKLTGDTWFMLTGGGLYEVTTIEFDRSLKLEPTALFVDGNEETAPPEDHPGGLPSVGLEFLDWQSLKPGVHSFSAHMAQLPGFPNGGGGGFYKTLHARQTITAREVAPAAN